MELVLRPGLFKARRRFRRALRYSQPFMQALLPHMPLQAGQVTFNG